MKCASRVAVFLQPLVFVFGSGAAGAITWPQEVTADEGTIVVYQPQPESLNGNVLKGRAAMSIELKDGSDPVFGTFWFDSKIETDKEGGTALIRDIKVTNVRWPDGGAIGVPPGHQSR